MSALNNKRPKYVFVTGGVASSLGKGIISSSLARLLQARGYSVTIQKLDPYINIDPGTLNPYEHGECYVTEDGAETDLDLGHYERFTSIQTSKANNVTTGRIYQSVINRERRGEYLGKTVQVVPHITDEIKRRIELLGSTNTYDIVITEIGGTVGDIESLPYIEAVRQLRYELGHGNTAVVHLTLIPYLSASGELKTKPTQHSVKMLLENGLQPDILVLRTERHLTQDIKRKVALFCNVDANAVMESIDVPTIYEVPLKMLEQQLDTVALDKLELPHCGEPDLRQWVEFVDKVKNAKQSVRIALVGKYTELPDAYKSISESFVHAGAANNVRVKLEYINSEKIDSANAGACLKDMCGILVAPGFGQRGMEGKIAAVRYARENRIPFLGICLGMQCAVIEFARNVLGYADANSSEMGATTHPVIDLMEEQKEVTDKGGTMRLGAYPCQLAKGTKIYEAYKTEMITERHRHRYEFNNDYLNDFCRGGMIAAGTNPDTNLVEAMELVNHPWFVGVQYHPEYKRLLIIGVILLGFAWFNSKQADKFAQEKAVADSIARVEGRIVDLPAESRDGEPQESVRESAGAAEGMQESSSQADSIRIARYGTHLLNAEKGEEHRYVVENGVMRITFSNRGGKVTSVELKDYKTFDGKPIEMYADDSAQFDMVFFLRNQYGDTRINSGNYYFECDRSPDEVISVTEGEQTVSMRLYADTASYVEYLYTVKKDDHMLGFELRPHHTASDHTYKDTDVATDLQVLSVDGQDEAPQAGNGQYRSQVPEKGRCDEKAAGDNGTV
ncbi:ctp synthase [Holotrichia oblita]|uniref:Ctp synthase n=1 Tax=Holotrichia oblita TaxID=644536 RepID=A0ACB9TR28_HOLOL|nr:ctp synthase [Holotrichia oblita]